MRAVYQFVGDSEISKIDNLSLVRLNPTGQFFELIDDNGLCIGAINPCKLNFLRIEQDELWRQILKQIPKKPKPYEHDYYLARCPTCYKDVPTHYVYGGVSFCENCGQPIDWSDPK